MITTTGPTRANLAQWNGVDLPSGGFNIHISANQRGTTTSTASISAVTLNKAVCHNNGYTYNGTWALTTRTIATWTGLGQDPSPGWSAPTATGNTSGAVASGGTSKDDSTYASCYLSSTTVVTRTRSGSSDTLTSYYEVEETV